MIMFVGGLGILFASMMLAYVFVRMTRSGNVQIGSIHLPWLLIVSTAVVLLASAAIQSAVRAVRRERQDRLRAWLLTTLILGLLFCILQVPSLASLLKQQHAESLAYQTKLAEWTAAGKDPFMLKGQPFFGIIFVFVVVHALHVLGGIVQLVFVTRGAFQGRYDHEYYNPVKHAAMYWHFLDVVWLVMYGTMVALG